LPFFFIPSKVFSFTFTKVMLLAIASVVPLLLWLISRLKEGKLEIPKGYLFFSAIAVPISYLLASLFSGVTKISIIGQGYEIDTFVGILMLFLLFFLVPVFFRENTKLIKIYFALFASFVIVSLFQLLRLIFGPGFLSFGGLLSDSTSNLVGKWNDLGVFFGLFSLLFLSTLELLKPKGMIRIFLYIGLVLSLVFTAVINFTAIWVMLGISGMFFFVYKVLFRNMGDTAENSSEWSIKKFLSVPSSIVFVLAIVFVLFSGTIGTFVNTKLNISQVEVRPSWGATFDIGSSAIKSDLLFGAGPNRFGIEWLQNKPAGINSTVFWNTNFNSGIGFIPSTLTTTGIVGFLSWLAFLGLLLFYGIRGILSSGTEDLVSRYISLSSFLSALFLWVFAVIYLPNVTILVLAFLFSGVFVASQIISGKIKTIRVSFIQNPKMGFVSVFLIVVAIIGTTTLGYVYTKKYISFINFQKALFAFNTNNDADLAEKKLQNAIRWNESDLYYRSMARLNVARLNEILSNTELPQDEARAQFQSVLADAITNATAATSYDNRNYENWSTLGDIYGSLVSLKVDGAYDSAISAYSKAIELNPHSPLLYLTLARVEAAHEDNEAARGYVIKALEEKSNYTEAVFFLSQIEIAEGNIEAAIKSTQAAATIAPNDPTVFFQLGLLHYNEKKYAEAIPSFERAVELSPNYSNAKYFLGLSYYYENKVTESIKQFEEVAALNPDNTEVKLILDNLKAGKDPFDGAKPPIDESPESRDTLPISETVKTPTE